MIESNDHSFTCRFTWFCFTASGAVVTLIIIASLWEKFQTNPTITGLDTDFHNWDVEFPAVTICPVNPTKQSVVNEFVKKRWGSNMTTDHLMEYVTHVANLSYNNLVGMSQYSDHDSLPQDDLRDLLYQVVDHCEDLFYGCEWKGVPYNCCDGFFPIFTENGFCYSFNSLFSEPSWPWLRGEPKTDKQKEYIYETDSKWALSFNMRNVENNNALVYIHSATELPGLDLAPQHVWSRRISKIVFASKETYTTDDVRQLSIRQRRCVFPDEIRLITDTVYSYTACMAECRMKAARKLCSCVPLFYKQIDGFPHCNLEGHACLANHTTYMQKSITCSCELSCMNTVYEVEKLVENPSYPESEDPLEVEFVSWPMVRYKREVLFGWVDLLVSFGGIAGLFLGFSLLSGVEIVYYFTMRAFCMVYRNSDQLEALQLEHEASYRRPIDLSLRPRFIKRSRITKAININEHEPITVVPFLN